jgi:hypothetical protein
MKALLFDMINFLSMKKTAKWFSSGIICLLVVCLYSPLIRESSAVKKMAECSRWGSRSGVQYRTA